MMELQLKIIGVLLSILAFVHVIFPRYFNWAEDLKPLSLINRELMYIHTFFIALTILLMGILCFFATDDLLTTRLGSKIALGLCLFWTARLLVQFIGYSPALWKGKRFETFIHVLFSFLWGYLSLVFFLVYYRSSAL